MNQAVQSIERYVKERRQTNERLVSWPLYFFLLSWITVGIYGLILYYKRVNRADRFGARKQAYYSSVIEFTRQHAQEKNEFDSVYTAVNDLEEQVKGRFTTDFRPINAGLSLLLTIVTLGFYGIYVVYRLDKFWVEIQEFEQDFDESLSQTWEKLGIVKYPIKFDVDHSVERSFGLYLALSVVTMGIWAIVWDYKIHTDPEKLYPEFDSAEDAVLAAVRHAG